MPECGRPPVLVFDLDGTILRVNSFPHWLLFLIGGRIPGLEAGRRARLSLRTASLLLPRKMGLMDHDKLMRGVQRAWWSATAFRGEGLSNGFQSRLLRHVRPNLKPLLLQVASDRVDAVLATAASADYAAGLGQRLGFRHVLATPPHRGPHEPPNRGRHKCDRVLDLLSQCGWMDRSLILLTDHLDDLPLMRKSHIVCWFGAAKHMNTARAKANNARFLFCRDLAGGGILDGINSLGIDAGMPWLVNPDADVR